MPNKKRITAMEMKFHASAVAMVKTDQTSTTQVSTLRAPSRSHQRASGTPKAA